MTSMIINMKVISLLYTISEKMSNYRKMSYIHI